MYGFVDENDVFAMSAMPTPASLLKVYLSKHGKPGSVILDNRLYGYFENESRWESVQFDKLYEGEEALQLRSRFKAYSHSLVLALGLQQDHLEEPNRLLGAWDKRLVVARKIGWMPEGN